MGLINADAFKAEGRELYRYKGWDLREVHYSQMDVESNIDNMPTIEAEPVKHGRWVIESDEAVMHCSFCGWVVEYYAGLEEEWNFCPRCGADMREVEE